MHKNEVDTKTRVLALFLVVSVFVGFVLFLVWADYKAVVLPNSNYQTIKEYEKYLCVRSDCLDDELVFLDASDGQRIASVYNHTEFFFSGTLEWLDKKGQVVYYIEVVCMRPEEIRQWILSYDDEIVDYRWKKTKTYEFVYPDISFRYYESFDSNNLAGYGWKNYVVASDKLTVEHCMELAKYIYVQDVLAGQDSVDLYFYDAASVRYESKDNLQFPLTSSAVYGAILEQEERSITIVTIQTDEVQELLKETMK